VCVCVCVCVPLVFLREEPRGGEGIYIPSPDITTYDRLIRCSNKRVEDVVDEIFLLLEQQRVRVVILSRSILGPSVAAKSRGKFRIPDEILMKPKEEELTEGWIVGWGRLRRPQGEDGVALCRPT